VLTHEVHTGTEREIGFFHRSMCPQDLSIQAIEDVLDRPLAAIGRKGDATSGGRLAGDGDQAPQIARYIHGGLFDLLFQSVSQHRIDAAREPI